MFLTKIDNVRFMCTWGDKCLLRIFMRICFYKWFFLHILGKYNLFFLYNPYFLPIFAQI